MLKNSKWLLVITVIAIAGCNSLRDESLNSDELPVIDRKPVKTALFFEKIQSDSVSGGSTDKYRGWITQIMSAPWLDMTVIDKYPTNQTFGARLFFVVRFKQRYLAGGMGIEHQADIKVFDSNGNLVDKMSETSLYETWGRPTARNHINATKKTFFPLIRRIADSKLIEQSIRRPVQADAPEYAKPSPQVKNIDIGDKGKKWALVIGLSLYKNAGKSGLANLSFAEDDAVAFKDSLVKLGWGSDHIKLLTDKNATKQNIERALEGWLSKAGKDDVIILYWSGHGFPDPDEPNKVYFACYDTDISEPYSGWRMDRVINRIGEKNARNVIVIADTCHAGKLITRGDKGIALRPYMEKLKKSRNVPQGWIFMVSAEADRKAIENSKWSHGAFTYCLIKGMEGNADVDNDGKVSMLELKAYMSSSMPEETQKVLGKAKHPIILTNSSDKNIWNLSLEDK